MSTRKKKNTNKPKVEDVQAIKDRLITLKTWMAVMDDSLKFLRNQPEAHRAENYNDKKAEVAVQLNQVKREYNKTLDKFIKLI